MKISKRLIPFILSVFLIHTLSAQSALRKADKQYELSDFANAIISYAEILDKQPMHLEANSRIADCYRHTNQLEKAIPYYQAAVNQQGVKDIYVFQYGLTLQELGRYEQAQQVFDRLAANSQEFRTRARQFSEACAYAKGFDEVSMFKVSNEFTNTQGSDFGPALFKGERLVFASSRMDIEYRNNRNTPASNSNMGNRLFITQRDKNGFLETPVTLHSGFGNGTHEGPLSYSPDGKWVAITKNSFIEGIRQIPSSGQEMTLHMAQCDENGDWTNAVPFPHNTTGYSTGYPAFSSDGKVLYFSSNRPGGYGGYDLYASYRTSNTWSVPENLGPAINSIGNEITPFHDGSSLYFASDFHRGFGGFDIFRAEESSGKWATLYHGGSGLNSSADDYGFVYDPVRNFGYFVSNRPGGKGNEDIYRAIKESETVVIKITDAATGKPIPNATIDFSKCGDRTYTATANGVFNFQIMDNLDCQITIGKPGYIDKALNISSVSLKLNRNIDVALTSENSAYRGKVVNGNNGQALERAKIITTNQKTGEVNETFSSSEGEYLVSMLPGSSYVLRYSKAGFVDLNLNIQTSSADNRILRNTELFPVGVGTPALASRTEKNAIPAPSLSSTTLQSSGYAIQLAAVSAMSLDLGPFQAAAGHESTVYTIRESGMTKVRAGIFSSRQEAERAQSFLKSRGYPGAFIVQESNANVPMVSSQTSSIRSSEAPARNISASKENLDLSGFLIRLATLSNMSSFNDANIQDIGIINRITKGPYTIIILSGYDDMKSAESALKRAKDKGFPEAYIVVKDGEGEFRKPR